MQDAPDLPFSDAESLRRGRYLYCPVVPGRLEFALEVRHAVLREPPSCIAVELPRALEDIYLAAVRRLPQLSVVAFPEEGGGDDLVYVPVEPCDPFTEGVRSGIELGVPVVFFEPSSRQRPHLPEEYPDSYAVRRMGVERYIAEYRLHRGSTQQDVAEYAAGMASRLQAIEGDGTVLVVVSLNMLHPLLDAMEQPHPPLRTRPFYPDVQLLNLHPESLAEVTAEYPFLQERYEQYRLLMESELIDRPRVQLALLRKAEANYQQNTGEQMSPWQRRLLARFARNLASTNGMLLPDLFDLTIAARSVVDDNFAWEVWDAANAYPPQQVTDRPETVRLSGQEMWLNTKRLRLRRRLPSERQRRRPRSLRQRPKEDRPGEWAEQLDGSAICSYPPEDLVVEAYGQFVKSKAQQLLSGRQERTEPFTTSLLDGIDIRETLRNWHEGRLYVKQDSQTKGDITSVVVVFDEDPQDRYTYLTTWLGENQNESDMAFYSTPPFDHIVGPGIGRAEYGGFLLSLPSRRLWDVWSDPAYDIAESKPERLLLAALEYSLGKQVAYVAPRPPRALLRSLAARLGKTIAYIPLGQLAADARKKVRVVHVLDGHERRAEAKDYIW